MISADDAIAPAPPLPATATGLLALLKSSAIFIIRSSFMPVRAATF